MNLIDWVHEVERLEAALEHHRGEVGLKYEPERPNPDERPGQKKVIAAKWVAWCNAMRCEGRTPEEAAAQLVERLETTLAEKIASAREKLLRLESAQSRSKLRIVHKEKPS